MFLTITPEIKKWLENNLDKPRKDRLAKNTEKSGCIKFENLKSILQGLDKKKLDEFALLVDFSSLVSTLDHKYILEVSLNNLKTHSYFQFFG